MAKYPDNFITLKEIYEGEDMQCLVTTFLEGPTLIEEFERLKVSCIYIWDKKLKKIFKLRSKDYFEEIIN